MADKKEPKNAKATEGSELWEAATRDVKRMPGKKAAASEGGKKTINVRETRVLAKKEALAPKAKGIDARTNEKLRRGKFEIDATIDLHGFRQSEARAELVKALTRCHVRGKRCVLVITGKGNRQQEGKDWWDGKPGVLKQMVPQWLGEAPLAAFVLQTHPAQAKHGGSGALYVLLRKKRPYRNKTPQNI